MPSTNQWGLELIASEAESRRWLATFPAPFDPFLEMVDDPVKPRLVIRSSEFDGLKDHKDVYSKGKDLLCLLNTAMGGLTPATMGAIVSFEDQGAPKFYHRMAPIRLRSTIVFGVAEFTIRDKDGKIIEVPPSASQQQEWVKAARINSHIHAAMKHLSGEPDWVELYKAYEALGESKLATGAISKNKRAIIARTANSEKRHWKKDHRLLVPMPIEDAKSLLRQWLSAAIEEVLAQ